LLEPVGAGAGAGVDADAGACTGAGAGAVAGCKCSKSIPSPFPIIPQSDLYWKNMNILSETPVFLLYCSLLRS